MRRDGRTWSRGRCSKHTQGLMCRPHNTACNTTRVCTMGLVWNSGVFLQECSELWSDGCVAADQTLSQHGSTHLGTTALDTLAISHGGGVPSLSETHWQSADTHTRLNTPHRTTIRSRTLMILSLAARWACTLVCPVPGTSCRSFFCERMCIPMWRSHIDPCH